MRLHYFFILLLVLFSACGGRKLSTGDARKAIVSLPQEILEKEDIDVVYVTQISGSSAVVESRVKTAFRLRKVDGSWVVKDIRIGHGQWEKIDDLAAALDRVKTEETRIMLNRISEAIGKYREETGSYPGFKDFVALTDILAPKYLDPLIRLDSWRNPFQATAPSPDSIKVVSAGPDGRFGTKDDLSITATP